MLAGTIEWTRDRGWWAMPKFLFEASYTTEGVKGLRRTGGTSRRDVIAQMAEAAGGRLEHLYFAFGDADVYAIFELPDNETATAFALAVNASGTTHARTVVLLTPEEVDAAAERTVEYRPPGA
jgi:uncharacterized protein with GYD domain